MWCKSGVNIDVSFGVNGGVSDGVMVLAFIKDITFN